MTLNGMYRIAAKDADALGLDGQETKEKVHDANSEPASEEEIRNNLKSVFDPEIPVNVVDLGLIYKVEIEPKNKVNVEMTLTSPNCPVAESLPNNVKENIMKVEGVTDVDLKLVWEPPWSKDKMSEAAKLELNL